MWAHNKVICINNSKGQNREAEAEIDGMSSSTKKQFTSKANEAKTGHVKMMSGFVSQNKVEHENDLMLKNGLAKANHHLPQVTL